MVPRTDFSPDYFPDYFPDAAGAGGGAVGVLETASISTHAGTIAAFGTVPTAPPGGGWIRLGGPLPWEYPLRAGRGQLLPADLHVAASAIHAVGTAAGALQARRKHRVRAGVIHARGIQNPSDDELLAFVAALEGW